jgi:hypothetical protein
MSRLIDADKLNDYFWDNRSKLFTSKDCMVAVDKQLAVKAIPLDKVKQAREEIQKLRGCSCSCSDGIIDDVEDILDKLIESEV